MEKVVKKYDLKDYNEKSRKDDLKYWLSRPCEERFAAVDFLRRQMHGNLPRLQRVVTVVKR